MGAPFGGWAIGAGRVVRVALCGMLVARAVAAQVVVSGILYDDSTGTPLRGTVMFVNPVDDSPVVHVVCDSVGRFRLIAPAGTYQLAAVRAEYAQTLSAPLSLLDGERMTVRIPLSATGDPKHRIGVLEHVHGEVPDHARDATRIGFGSFDARGTNAPGLHYDRAALANSPSVTLGQFLQGLPGLSVGRATSAASMQMSRGSSTFMNSAGSSPSDCHVGWFVDGHRMDSPAGIDQVTDGLAAMQLDIIEGLEVFRGLSEMPPEFATPDLRCGAIAIWTRRR